MRELVLSAPGAVEWRERRAPELPSGMAALVRPVAVATCDFDHLLVSGRMSLPGPIPLGHECVAEVISVGGEVRTVTPGDVVVVPFQISCGQCTNCAQGLSSACRAVPWLSCFGLGPAAGDWGGAVADVLVVPWADAMLEALPAGVAPEEAVAASCNLSDAYRAVAPHLARRPGSKVFVTGGAFSSISHYTVGLAVALGADVVDYYSGDAGQRAKAESLGARVLDTPDAVEPGGYEIAVDNSQDPELLSLAVFATAAGGHLTATAMYPAPRTPLPLMEMFTRCITFVTGQPHVRHCIAEVLPLLASGMVKPADVTDEVRDWDEAAGAFTIGQGKKVVCTRA